MSTTKATRPFCPLKRRAAAQKTRQKLVRLRVCLRWSTPPSVPSPPKRTSTVKAWRNYARHMRTLVRSWQGDCARAKSAIVHPHISSAASWKPLLRYVGWPASQIENAVTCIRRESGGNPNAHNASGASGLYQLMPRHWRGRFDPYDPERNARYALMLWRKSGWHPWVTM